MFEKKSFKVSTPIYRVNILFIQIHSLCKNKANMMRYELGKAFSGRVLDEFIVALIGINGVPLSRHRTVIINLTLAAM